MINDDKMLIYEVEGDYSIYKVFQTADPSGIILHLEADEQEIATWDAEYDHEGEAETDFEESEDGQRALQELNDDEEYMANYYRRRQESSIDVDYDEDSDDDKIDKYSFDSAKTSDYWKSYFTDTKSFYGGYKPSPVPPDPELDINMDDLNNSDTLVIHCKDRSTQMLAQVYEGRGWDVVRNGNIDKKDLIQLINSHDKIICLGHGTPSGLINVQGGGLVINSDIAPYLKDKKLFCIWCYAATFLKNNGLPGHFCSDNAPSEKWECKVVGFDVSAEWILESITYWCKCCADVVDEALNGNPASAVKHAQDAYWEKYGDDPNPEQLGVSKFNTNTLQVS